MSQDYWEQRWQTNQTGWDIREVSPPLARFADYAYPAFHRLPVLVPGCGSGYEGMYLLDTGYTDITMLDISPTAIGGMEKRLEEKYQDWRSRLRLVCGDFFRHKGQYALILEQTFFCALTPSLRPHYVAKMAGLLQENGVLAGVLFDRDFEGGPPYGGSVAEYRALFSPYFQLERLEPCHNSIPPRAGSEAFILFRKK